MQIQVTVAGRPLVTVDRVFASAATEAVRATRGLNVAGLVPVPA